MRDGRHIFLYYDHKNDILPLELGEFYTEYTLREALFKLNQLLSKASQNKLS